MERACASGAEQAVAAAYVAGWRSVGRLSEHHARALFDRIAARMHARHGTSVRRLRANLARVAARARR